MREQEFVSLLKTHPECLFDERRFRAILNDLFPQDVRMNHILVLLFHQGLSREIEVNQVLNDPIYYRYKKILVKNYGIDQKLAEDAIRFWLICYGQKVLKRTLRISTYLRSYQMFQRINLQQIPRKKMKQQEMSR